MVLFPLQLAMDKVLRSFAEAEYSDAFRRQFLQKVRKRSEEGRRENN